MKRTILILAILIGGNLFSQEEKKCKDVNREKLKNGETKVFVLNLAEPQKKALEPKDGCDKGLVINTKSPIAFSLINANPYKYTYAIDYKFIDFFEDDFRDVFKKSKELKLKPEDENTTDEIKKEEVLQKLKKEVEALELEKQIENTTGNTQNMLKIERAKIELDNLKLIRNEIKNEIIELEAKIKKDGEHLVEENGTFRDEQLKEVIEEERLNLKNNNRFLALLNGKIQAYRAAIVNQKISDLESLNSSESVQKKEAKKREEDYIKTEKKRIKILLSDENYKLQKLLNEIEVYTIRLSSEDFLDEDEFKTIKDDFQGRFDVVIDDLRSVGKEALKLDNFLDEYNKRLVPTENIAKKIKRELEKMHSLKFKSFLIPIDFNGENIDVVDIKVARTLKIKSNVKPEEYSYKVWVRGGLKIDVSGGAFITSLVNKEYIISNESETDSNGNEETFQLISEKNIGDFQYGFGSTVNISYRNGTSWVKPSLSVGALFTSNQDFQFLTGFGLILGKKQRIVLHGGLSMGIVEKITNNLKADGETRYNLTSDTVPTKERFSFGHFFGVTYNFGKTKSQKDVKQ